VRKIGEYAQVMRKGVVKMKRFLVLIFALFISVAFLTQQPAEAGGKIKKDHVRYVKYEPDSLLKAMREEMDSLKAVRDSITAEIKKKWDEKKKKEREERKVIRFDLSRIKKPSSIEEFHAPFHFPPVAQHLTGTCWSFSTTSFFESEVYRLTGQKVKLSEIYTVYWEFVEKARGFVQKRGNQPFEQGSECDAVVIIWKKYGIVPESVYNGLLPGRDKHNHSEMTKEMKDYLRFVKEHNYWDEEEVIKHIRVILDKYIGRPPEKFIFNGKEMTPKEFLSDVLKLNLDDYVQFMSTLSIPFYTKGEFKVPDNWRPTKNYYNVPLDEFYRYIKIATDKGYTVVIGGDVSEPGYNGYEDVAVVPTFDIPPEYIDQDSREFRFYNRTSTDDHGIHLLARKRIGGHDWYLIKDSSRSARKGKFKGYLFYRDDYIKLKMLTYMVHKDVVKDLLKKFEQ